MCCKNAGDLFNCKLSRFFMYVGSSDEKLSFPLRALSGERYNAICSFNNLSFFLIWDSKKVTQIL